MITRHTVITQEGEPFMTTDHDDHPPALSEAEICDAVRRCDPLHRPAFEAWLRGGRRLDGDPIEPTAELVRS